MTHTEQELKDRLGVFHPDPATGERMDAFARNLAASPAARLHPSKSRRAAGMLALPAAALATAGVVIAAVTIASGSSDDQRGPGARASSPAGSVAPSGALSTPDPSGVEWRWRFTVAGLPSGWTAGVATIFADRQEVALSGPNSAFCRVEVYAPDAFNMSRVGADRTDVAVGSAGGYSATIVDAEGTARPAVAWQYAPGSWAVNACRKGSTDPEADALATAAAISPDPRPFAVPFSIGYLPPGMVPTFAYTSDPADPGYSATVLATPPGGSGPGLDSYQIDLASTAGVPAERKGESVTLSTPRGPRTAVYTDPGRLTVQYDGFQLTIGAGYGMTSRDELIRIAENLDIPGDPADRSSWFDAAQALP